MNFFEKCDELLNENSDDLSSAKKLSESMLKDIENEFNLTDSEISFVDDDGNQANIDIDLTKQVFDYDDVYQDGVQSFIDSVNYALTFNQDYYQYFLKKYNKKVNDISNSFFPDWSSADKKPFIAHCKSLSWPKEFKKFSDLDSFIESVYPY
jgi:hypothetical protein